MRALVMTYLSCYGALEIVGVLLLLFQCIDKCKHNMVANHLVVAAHTWNDLPLDVASAGSLSTFRQRLKTHLFLKSFTRYILDF